MKTLFAIASLAMLGCAIHADVHNNTWGALVAMVFAILWFVAYCNADKIP